MIKAIETHYAGCRFRSRLEARWAVFFDHLGIAWEYEPQGFESSLYENEVVRYLPDFWLPETRTWVEVKGSPEQLAQESAKLAIMCDWRQGLPDVSDSATRLTSRGLLILGPIPYLKPRYRAVHPIIQHHKGLVINGFVFTTNGPEIIAGNGGYGPWGIFGEATWSGVQGPSWNSIYDPDGFTGYPIPLEPMIHRAFQDSRQVRSAYESARSARFEHGESG